MNATTHATDTDYEQLQQDAAIVPRELITAMAERDGKDEGGLTLSREHIITINRYANFVFALPRDHEPLLAWLGYTDINEPELKPSAWATLFTQLLEHAKSWLPLSDQSKRLASELAATALNISTGGQSIIELIDQTLKDDKGASWKDLEVHAGTPLSAGERENITQLIEYMNVLNTDVRNYATRVETVREQTETFRNTARLKLIPGVKAKGAAVERKQADGEVESYRRGIAQLDTEIEALAKEYDQYVKMALSGLSAGPIGVAITGGIYGSKAEKVRKERNMRLSERHVLCEKLRARENLEGRMEVLNTFITELDSRLQDVVTSASHLQTAWDMVSSYIDASISRLDNIERLEVLRLFRLHFNQFLAQWHEIHLTAVQLTRIFDEAASAQ